MIRLRHMLFVLLFLCLMGHSEAATVSSGGSGGYVQVTAFPGSPFTGMIVIVTDDSVVGACDSAAGVATTICRWNGSAWVKLGDGTSAGGALSSTDIDTSAELASILTDETGTGALAFATSPTFVTPLLGTPTSGVMTNVTGTAAGLTAGLATAATALASDPTDCAVGEAARGINASGTAQNCANYVEEPGANGFPARTAANTFSARTVTGTTNQIAVTNGDGVSGNPTLALSSTLVIPGAQVDFTEASGDGACAANDYWVRANSTTSTLRKCQNGTVTDLDTSGGGSIGGSTGATDNAIIRADGTGGATVQSSGCTISDTNLLTCSGGFSSTGGTGIFTITEGAAPGAPAGAGEHNIYVDSSDSKFKSHENGGVVVTYVRTADNLSSLAATTSAELAGVLSDELGSAGGFTRGTGSTHTSPTFAGSAPVMADGVTWTFNPNGTNSGLNIGSQAGLVGTPNNGDLWYDSTGNKYKCRENGVTVDCISTGAGSGDITDVVAGAGIAVATPGGPAPTVSWDASTFVSDVTLWNAGNASRTLTANLSGATDPVITFSDSTVNVSTGTLQQGGVNVSTASSTSTLTNKTLDAEGTGNVITLPHRLWFRAAYCQNATAVPLWDLPTTNAAVATCMTGTNTQKGVLDFADGSDLSAQQTFRLPSTWTGTMDVNIKWFSATITGNVVWQIQTICVADVETDDPAFNTASTVTDTTKGAADRTNDATLTAVTITGCAADELLHLKIRRDSGHASDTMAGTARLIGAELVYREAM